MEIRKSDSCLLVIDAQNDVCSSKGDFARMRHTQGTLQGQLKGIEGIQYTFINGIKPIVQRAQHEGLSIAYILSIYKRKKFKDVSDDWLTVDPELQNNLQTVRTYRDLTSKALTNQLWRILVCDDWGKLPKGDEPVFFKDDHHPFLYQQQNNGLEQWLGDYKNALVAGFTTDYCVEAGVKALAKTGFVPIVLEDCVCTPDHKIANPKTGVNKGRVHQQTLNQFVQDGITVIDSHSMKFV